MAPERARAIHMVVTLAALGSIGCGPPAVSWTGSSTALVEDGLLVTEWGRVAGDADERAVVRVLYLGEALDSAGPATLNASSGGTGGDWTIRVGFSERGGRRVDAPPIRILAGAMAEVQGRQFDLAAGNVLIMDLEAGRVRHLDLQLIRPMPPREVLGRIRASTP